MATVTFKRGDTLPINYTRIDANGAAVDITGSTVRCEMVRDASRVVLTCSITNAAAGAVYISLTPAQTTDLALGDYKADVQFTDASGVVQSSETFTVTCLEDITGAAD